MNKAKFFPILLILLIGGIGVQTLISCSSDDDGGGGSFIVSCPNPSVSDNSMSCDGQTYKTVVIGTQTWMAENLNYNATGSKCYGEDGEVEVGWDFDNDTFITETLSPDKVQENCAKYGRLYNWATARSVCPDGWHLPSYAEWTTLTDFVESDSECSDCAGIKLKSTTGWDYNGGGTNDYYFSALPGGLIRSDGIFYDVGNYGRWWSASEGEGLLSGNAYYLGMSDGNESTYLDPVIKSYLLSVRCIQD